MNYISIVDSTLPQLATNRLVWWYDDYWWWLIL